MPAIDGLGWSIELTVGRQMRSKRSLFGFATIRDRILIWSGLGNTVGRSFHPEFELPKNMCAAFPTNFPAWRMYFVIHRCSLEARETAEEKSTSA